MVLKYRSMSGVKYQLGAVEGEDGGGGGGGGFEGLGNLELK